jgi:hypothetical protein
VSYDLYFWPAGTADDPCRLAEQLADEDAGGLVADERVLAFRGELLRRWPEFADMIAPWHHDLGWRQPWGRTDLADRFVGLTLSSRWMHTAALPALAHMHGLVCYDPQADEVSRAGEHVGSGSVEAVRGWVNEDNVIRLLEKTSAWIGYAYDDLDEAALTGALDGTNDESVDGWFQYPLEGNPPLTVCLARSPGSAVVSVRLVGTIDAVLAARIETLLDLLGQVHAS